MSALLPLSELLPKTVDGIIFSAPLIPPVLDGRKTVTRRMARKWLKRKAGDLLFVRENWRLLGWDMLIRSDCAIEYAADRVERHVHLEDYAWARREADRVTAWRRKHGAPYLRTAPLRPSLLLPRWASRCVLRLTEDPRLEPLAAITEEDAIREGAPRGEHCDAGCARPHRDGFIDLWRRLHTKPGERWQDSPVVVRLAFERAA